MDTATLHRHFPRALAILALLVVAFGAAAQEQEQTWKINLKDADIGEFIAQIAAITGKTFVVDPRVQGKVTVISNDSLDRDGIYELFLSVLRVHGYAAIESGEVTRIQQQTLIKQSSSPVAGDPDYHGQQFVTRVIPAQNVESAELVKILRPMIPQYGHIASVAEPNVVIISDHAENFARLTRIIEQIDVADDDQVVMVSLEHAWVGTVVEMLQRVAPEQLGRNAKGPQSIQVIANERNNSLVLRGAPRPIAEVLKLIEKLDQPATSTGTTRVLYLSHADAVKVAEILSGLVTGRSAAPAGGEGAATTRPTEISIQADESLNALVIRADPTVMSELMAIIEKLDVRRTQVLIEAAIVEVSVDASRDVGVDIAAVDADGDSVPFINTALSAALANILTAAVPGGDDGATTGNGGLDPIAAVGAVSSPSLAVAKINRNGLSFAAIIQALATNSEANLLSTPSIMTLDNEEAKIVVGQEVPFRTGTFTTDTDGASNPFTTIQREDVGITLTVTPHIHDGSSVRLEVSQEVENVAESALGIGEAGFSDVVTNKRTIETTIIADDGETIVLGGLIQDDIRNTQRKVPLLGDIPWLGRLFQNNSRDVNKRNLLVFLRPTVLREPEEVEEVTESKYNRIWEIEIRSRDESQRPEPEEGLDGLFEGRHGDEL